MNALILFAFFSIFYLVNLQRGLVRHSLMENILYIISGTLTLALASFALINKNRSRLPRFLMAVFAGMLLVNVNLSSFPKGQSMLTEAFASETYNAQYEEVYAFDGTRMEDNVIPKEAEELKQILDTVLDPDETYFDFSSQNYYYALVGRKNPAYVNQSPLMLNGDVGQEDALAQIAKEQPPLVLFPNAIESVLKIDLIMVNYKYYLITEYIYDNYTILAKTGAGYLFCLNDRKDEYARCLKENGLILDSGSESDLSYVDVESLHMHHIKIRKEDGGLILKKNGNDAFVFKHFQPAYC